MDNHPKPQHQDPENPAWTAEDFALAQPAHAVLGEIFGASTAQAMLKPRGRPRVAHPKQRVTIRLSPEVLAHFQASGAGWQTRIDAALRQMVESKAC